MLFHLAERRRWEDALADGAYTASTLGRELADEGFVHLARGDQVEGVAERYYRGVADLVLLHVDESRLTSPLVDEQVGVAPDGTPLVFPHLYGPLDLDAVVRVEPFTAPAPP